MNLVKDYGRWVVIGLPKYLSWIYRYNLLSSYLKITGYSMSVLEIGIIYD